MDANKIVNGKINGIRVGVIYIKNFKTVTMSKSFPANSLMYSHIACKTKISMSITNTLIKVLRYVVNMYLSNIFT